MAKSPQQVAAKWASNLSQSTESIKAGVMAVSTSPMELAARRKDAYVAGVQRAAASGKWERGLRRGNLSTWQESVLTKGLSRIPMGAQAGKGKMEAFMGELIPFQQSKLQQLNSTTPRGDEAQNRARMMAWFDAMQGFRRGT